jgi:Domain of unknown function (DUF4136)
MIRLFVVSALLLGCSISWGQEFKVEYDKNRDYSQYKTFRFGEGELVTPKDQQQMTAAQVDKLIKNAMTQELAMKGLKRVDSAADLVISYVVGTLARSDAGDVGPLGMTPGSMDRTYMKDYRQGNLVIDLNDNRNIKVWRVNATMEMSAANAEKVIGQVIQKGFKKYPKAEKEKKKKK